MSTVLVLIGERPGLSVADSLGNYLTHLPRPRVHGHRSQLDTSRTASLGPSGARAVKHKGERGPSTSPMTTRAACW